MDNPDQELLANCRRTLAKSVRALDKCCDTVIAKLDAATEYDSALASHLAWVNERISAVTTAIRQLEKHDKAMSRTPEQRFRLVCEYIRNELDPPRRATLVDLLSGLEQERRVLS